MNEILAHPILVSVVLLLLLLQGIFIFNDAQKNGEKYPWLWGLFGLLNVPGSLIVYLLVTRVFRKRKS
ncbi:MAG TPA: hypothetical protein DDY49_14990 [Paenibacillaceae bacterium]|nr:hypothetical protein [Paenibacillaceae bacterium]